MSVFLVPLLAHWIRGSKVALLHLHVGKLLLGQSQSAAEARKLQIPVKGFRWGLREGESRRRAGGSLHSTEYTTLAVSHTYVGHL